MIVTVDVETTGVDSAKDAVVEFAAVPLTRAVQDPDGVATDVWRVGAGHDSLVAPGRRVPPGARAVHHLSDGELRNAPQLSGAVASVLLAVGVDALDLSRPPEHNSIQCFAAHNAEFDSGFVGATVRHLLGRDVPWLCTWRLSLHLFPEVDSHSNQALRYAIPGVDAALRSALPADALPHWAIYDATTTAYLLQRMLQERSLGELLELQHRPVLQRVCRFGKHRGSPWAALPRDYLRWVLRADPPFDRDVEHTARYYLGEVA